MYETGGHETRDQETASRDEQRIAQLLKLVGRRPPLPAETRAEWARVFAAELAPVIERRRRRRKILRDTLALCASVTLFYLVFASPLQRYWEQDVPIGHITKVLGEGWRYETANRMIRLTPDDPLVPGIGVVTESGSLVALTLQQTQIRLNRNTEVKIYSGEIRLLKGQLYVDSGAVAAGRQGILVSTPLARIRDIGTQFTVSYDADGVAATVREGALLVAIEEGEFRANAHPDYAQRVQVSRDNDVVMTRTDKQGEEWDWSIPLAESFVLEGRSALEFLQWVSRETGVNLVFADAAARRNAKQTILHGDISAFAPGQAVDIVLATTSLSAQRPDKHTLKIFLAANR